MRSEPRIMHWEPPADGLTCALARELARGLVAAADLLTCLQLDEAAR
jgi:hypothetical protein